MHKDGVRRLIVGMKSYDAISLLTMLATMEDISSGLTMAMKDPAIYVEDVDPSLALKIRDEGVVPTIRVVVFVLLRQRFNVLPPPAATVIAAGASMGVAPTYAVEKRAYCAPYEHSMRGGKERWELYRRGVYHMSFDSDAIAAAMLELGVKVDR
jgi:hypothetical protein